MSSATTTLSSALHDPSSAAYKKAKRTHLKTTRNRNEHVESEWTPFRVAEKKYKARFPPPDLSNVLDLAVLDESRVDEISGGGWSGKGNVVQYSEIPLRCEEGSSNGRKAYVFPSTPGTRFVSTFEIYVLIAISSTSGWNRTCSDTFLRPSQGAKTSCAMGFV